MKIKVKFSETGNIFAVKVQEEEKTFTAHFKDVVMVDGHVDLTGYATEEWVMDGYQPKGDYLTAVPDGYAKTEDIPTKPEDIGAQPSGNYALKTEIPFVPVQSVNGKTGAVQLSAADVKARPETWMPSAQDVGALPNTYIPPNQTSEQVGADPKGSAASAVSQHNTADDSHNDIRLEVKAINNRLAAFFDSDNQTLDELSEIVAYITNNKTLIDSITTSKVSVTDIINNLTTNVTNKPLSAAQGVVLKGLIDALSNSLLNYQPKGNYLTSFTETDPTVPSWAKASSKPSYSKSEVGLGNVDNVKQYSASNPPPYPVTSVNGKTGAVTVSVPTKVSQLQNDAGYLTQHQDISGKLDTSALPSAINTALEQAKESGKFDGADGKDGYTPQKNVDYFDGQQGPQGEPGKDGTSVTVKAVAESTEDGGINMVTFSDGKTVTIKNGSKGSTGATGEDGFSPVATVTQTDGGAVVSITDKDGTTTATINHGADGRPGKDGADGKDGTSATHSWNGTTLTIISASGTSSADLKGEPGKDGNPGKDGSAGADGVSPTVAVSKSGKVTTVSITDKNGTKTATINDGADGSPGSAGKDGTSVTVKSTSESTADGGSNTVTFSDGKSITIKNGSKGDTGDKGDSGVYVGTEAPVDPNVIVWVNPNGDTDADGIPSYWQTALDDGVEAINIALCEAGRNKSAFMFYSDAHWNENSQMSPALLKYLYQNTGVTKTFFGGDVVNIEATDYGTMKYLWEWRKQLKDLPNHHSVVGNHDDGNATNNLFSEHYVYGYLLAAEETPDIVRGEGIYYYVDSPSEKTRYLCLDTAYKGVDSEQRAFIIDALKSTPDNWHIIAVAHMWYMPDYDQYDVKPIPLLGLCNAASAIATLLDNYNSRSGEFSNCGGRAEFCIGGHAHIDHVGKTDGGIPIIIVETDSKHTRSGLTYTAGTTTESSVNGIVADYNNDTLTIVRVGRGNSFTVDLLSGESTDIPGDSGYTNMLHSAINSDGSAFVGVNGEKGYKSGYRLNSSGVETSQSNMYVTGFIPVKQNDVVRLSGIEWCPSSEYASNCYLHLYQADFTIAANGYARADQGFGISGDEEFDPSGNLVRFTLSKPSNGGLDLSTVAYMRLSSTSITADSIITINEPIGAGAYTNLIPTAVDTDGVTIYNGIGYKENIRMSGSTGQFKDNTGSDCTGYIKTPVGEAFTVYMKNITANTADNYGCNVHFFNETGVAITNSFNYSTVQSDGYRPVYDDNGNVIQFTVSAKAAAGYMVIGAVNIDSTSIITINEPIE